MLTIKISRNFKKKAINATLAVCLFIFTYLVLIILSTALMIGCIIAGIGLLLFKPSIYTFLLGAGIVIMGFVVLIFLFKFALKKHVNDRSHLKEISPEDEPKLYDLIKNIAHEVGTAFPRHVYLSADTNASVFYDSTFWSMFLPVKKNLVIGMGLISSSSQNELKAVIAHELGHFSQRSMKVGSFVYQVNIILFNLLGDDEKYNQSLNELSTSTHYIGIFIGLARYMIRGIQWVLNRLYRVVNINHLALSREMEFHADHTATLIAGKEAVIHFLLRTDLASQCFNEAFERYTGAEELVATKNLYSLQRYLLSQYSERDISFRNDLPLITESVYRRIHPSKLMVVDKWSSHPSHIQRIEYVQSLSIDPTIDNSRPAYELLNDHVNTEIDFTATFFIEPQQDEEIKYESLEEFISEWKKSRECFNYPKTFNGYYSYRLPVAKMCNELAMVENETYDPIGSDTDFFSNKVIDQLHEFAALSDDINNLSRIQDKQISCKTFHYDGKIYKQKEASDLLTGLKEEQEKLSDMFSAQDELIGKHFLMLSEKLSCKEEYKSIYEAYVQYDKLYDELFERYNKLSTASYFMSVLTPYNQIDDGIRELSLFEAVYKPEVKKALFNKVFEKFLTDKIRATINDFIDNMDPYYIYPEYKEKSIEILISFKKYYPRLLQDTFNSLKKDVLVYQAEMLTKIEKNKVVLDSINEFKKHRIEINRSGMWGFCVFLRSQYFF